MNSTPVNPRQAQTGEFVISNDRKLLQLDRVHKFLSEKSYWAKDIPRALVDKAAQNSLCFGVYQGEMQIGYARVVSDFATFAWLADVYIEEEFRGRGLSKRLIHFIRQEPELKRLRRFLLATKDAHGLYAQFGFEISKTPDFWMEIKDTEAYRKFLDS